MIHRQELSTPDEVDKSISGDTAKLYRLIWNRFTASQMADAVHATMNVEITAGDYLFKASGYTVTFEGFTALYEEATDEKEKKETALPDLEEGMVLRLRIINQRGEDYNQVSIRYLSEHSEIDAISKLMSCLNRQEISKVASVKIHAQDK